MKKVALQAAIIDQGIIPVFSHADFDICAAVMLLCYRAGMRVFELTNRVDGAVEFFKKLTALAAKDCPGMIVIIGTVHNSEEAAPFLEAGTPGIVGPNFNRKLAAELAGRDDVLYCPGCRTPSEACDAQDILGKDSLIKAFPASSIQWGEIRSWCGATKSLRLMATGGVDPSRDTLKNWFQKAKVCAVGIGGELFAEASVTGRDWTHLEGQVSAALALLAELRKPK